MTSRQRLKIISRLEDLLERKKINEHQRDVYLFFRNIYGKKHRTLAEVGEHYSISRERCRQIVMRVQNELDAEIKFLRDIQSH